MRAHLRRASRALFSLGALALLAATCAGCGPVLIGVGTFVSTLGSDSSRKDNPTPPTVTVVTPSATGATPSATVDYTLFDDQAATVDLEVRYTATFVSNGQVRQGVATSLTGAGDGATGLSTSAAGVAHQFVWDYVQDLSSSAAARVVLEIRAKKASGTSLVVVTNAFLVGNDAPEFEYTALGYLTVTGATGNLVIAFDLRDSVGDVCSIEATFSGPGTNGPQPITALVASSLAGLDTDDGGAPTTFTLAWDTRNQPGIGNSNQTVTITLTPRDQHGLAGTPRSFGPLTISNNTQPIASLADASISPDTSQDIGLQVKLSDLESDRVSLQVQYSTSTVFPPLPQQTLSALPYVTYGRTELRAAGALGADELFAPGFVTNAPRVSWGHPLTGATLEVLEPPGSTPIALTPAPSDPVGALVESSGATCLVADRGAGSLLRVDLATGAVTTLVTGLGQPEYLALEGSGALLISDATPSTGRVLRVDLGTLALTTIATNLDQPRGIAPVDSRAVLVLEEGTSSLVQLDLLTLPAARTTLVTGLSFPRGLAVDPLDHAAFVAERGPAPQGTSPALERVSRVDLRSRERRTLVSAATSAIRAPSGIALAGDHCQLFVTSEEGGASQLFRFNRQNLSLPLRALPISPLSTPLGLASDPTRRRVFAVETGLDRLTRVDLEAAVQSTRTIASLTAATIRLTSPLPSAPPAGTRFRVRRGSLTGLRTSPTGITHRLRVRAPTTLGSPQLFFRVVPTDAGGNTGGASTTSAPLTLQVGPFAPTPIGLSNAGSTRPLSVCAGDFDGDGDLDLAVSHETSHDVVLHRQTSPGVFQAGWQVLTNASMTRVQRVASADFDRNGLTDIVATGFSSNNLLIFPQTAAGTFGTPTILTHASVTRPAAVAVGDMNGDGLLDLVAGYVSSSNVGIWLQTAPGTWNPTPVLVSGGFTSATAVALADADSDGDLDLAVTGVSSGNVVLFLQLTPLGFAPGISLSDQTSFCQAVEFGDFDGDGDLDLFTTSSFSNSATQFKQSAAGVLPNLGSPIGSGLTTLNALGVVAGDFDRDGRHDVCVGASGGGNLAVFYQDGAGGLSSTPAILEHSQLVSPQAIASADVDGDGGLDLLSPNRGGTLSVFLHTDRATFEGSGTLATVLKDTVPNGAPSGFASGDLDGDGNDDLVVAHRATNRTVVFTQLAPGVFDPGPYALPAGLSAPTRVALGDLDGDRDLDVVVGGTNAIAVYQQTGPKTFAAPTLIPTTTPGDLSLADLDGDGDLDLVSAATASDQLLVFFQTSPGTFAITPLVLSAGANLNAPLRVVAADLDGDGDLDLASANRDSDTVTVFRQTSPGVFGPAIVLSGSTLQASGITAEDADGDGDLDLIVVSAGSNAVSLFFQTGPGTFSAPTVLALGAGSDARGVAAGDLDGDGDLDLVVANRGTNDLAVFFQENLGTFQGTPTRLSNSASLSAPVDARLLHVDGDGDLDVVSVNEGSHTVSVFFKR